MVQISEGRNAFVLVDDEKAQEYQIEESTSGLVKTYTCCKMEDDIVTCDEAG